MKSGFFFEPTTYLYCHDKAYIYPRPICTFIFQKTYVSPLKFPKIIPPDFGHQKLYWLLISKYLPSHDYLGACLYVVNRNFEIRFCQCFKMDDLDFQSYILKILLSRFQLVSMHLLAQHQWADEKWKTKKSTTNWERLQILNYCGLCLEQGGIWYWDIWQVI